MESTGELCEVGPESSLLLAPRFPKCTVELSPKSQT
jgi:hypothetical protein